MSTTEHVLTHRLFEYASDGIRLTPKELLHLDACPECEEIVRNFRHWIRYAPVPDTKKAKAS